MHTFAVCIPQRHFSPRLWYNSSLATRPAGQVAAVQQRLRAKQFIVSGLVQGVGYRYFAQRVAERLGVSGYVKNRRDGRVEVYALGTPEQLQGLQAELERGPRMASVSGVEATDAQFLAEYADGFSVEHDW